MFHRHSILGLQTTPQLVLSAFVLPNQVSRLAVVAVVEGVWRRVFVIGEDALRVALEDAFFDIGLNEEAADEKNRTEDSTPA